MMIFDPEKRKEAMELLLRQVWRESFTDSPKRSDYYEAQEEKVVPFSRFNRGHTYLGLHYPSLPGHITPQSVRTFETLFSVIGDERTVTYCKPNTFWHWKGMEEQHLRFLNAFVVDIDVPDITTHKILWLCEEAGICAPTAINKTPHGAHVWFVFDKKMPIPKAKTVSKTGQEYSKTVSLYKIIQRKLYEALGGDPQAATPVQYFRIPRDLTYYNPEHAYSFQEWVKWLHTEFPACDPSSPVYAASNSSHFNFSGNLMDSKAIQILMQGVVKDYRNSACFALACVMRHSGYSEEKAFNSLSEWNLRCTPPQSETDVCRTTKSAFRGKWLPSKRVFELTGYRLPICEWLKNKKARKDRVRMHPVEWTGDIFVALKSSGGRLVGTQVELARKFKMPVSSFKKLLKKFKGDKKAPFQVVTRRGRDGVTLLFLRNIVHKPSEGVPSLEGNFRPVIVGFAKAAGFGAISEVVGSAAIFGRAGPP